MGRDEIEELIESLFREVICRLGLEGNFYDFLHVLRAHLAARFLEDELRQAGYNI